MQDVQLFIGCPQSVLSVADEDMVSGRLYEADGVGVAIILLGGKVADVLMLADFTNEAHTEVLLANP